MAGISLGSCVAEAVGTFILVLTVGCNVLSRNPVWGGVSIASALMVMVYALGGVSGAHLNPAVSLALGLASKLEGGWKQVAAYSAVQVFAGLLAGVTYSLLFGSAFNLGPTRGYYWWQAMTCELVYTFLLCFVVLNAAASKRLGGKNQFYGLAIGFVIVAGAYGPGAVSGGCFNPAVAIAIDAVSIRQGFGWCVVYASFEIMGATLAVAAFWIMRHEEKDFGPPPDDYTLQSKLTAEAIGTFVLVLTVGMNVIVHSKAAAFSIASALSCMIYAVGDVSGGHFNPAVTTAIVLSGRSKINIKDAGQYILVQVIAGIAAAFVYEAVHNGITFPLRPGDGFDWASVAVAEIVFTFVLCFVVLTVATVQSNPAPELTGFIIGSCVTVGGLAIGSVSGGSLNPAVSLGIATCRKILGGGAFLSGLFYVILEIIGGVVASGLFRLTYPEEFGEQIGLPMKAS
mmetsp:Transcript_2808/g.6571  ORF Transcript_2808/g.6571 Transcript_2808/m.6571 type:complete len:456 (-) Transcript_2808:73-1440(-)|eukprot:CAMPEP_0171099406 /NCGR_PEP_ID=MMETSP0766_2-20121228/51430_1 /TAXON_ID=439317 /ORGANISM="Gambierdiscus australes, Strain CAWD 149" /LENGTH=455 /DNA_ID=CAMNT_0011559023 /DNA_START=102 /DNA_END=1469 /DNA_ORIENTATION=-